MLFFFAIALCVVFFTSSFFLYSLFGSPQEASTRLGLSIGLYLCLSQFHEARSLIYCMIPLASACINTLTTTMCPQQSTQGSETMQHWAHLTKYARAHEWQARETRKVTLSLIYMTRGGGLGEIYSNCSRRRQSDARQFARKFSAISRWRHTVLHSPRGVIV